MMIYRTDSQNRHQKVFNREALRLCGGGLEKINQNYSVSRFNLGGLGALFGGAKPAKAPHGDGTAGSAVI